jgi:hypothetical protein
MYFAVALEPCFRFLVSPEGGGGVGTISMATILVLTPCDPVDPTLHSPSSTICHPHPPECCVASSQVGVAFGGRRLVHRVLRLCASPRWTTVTVDWVISSAIASVLWARARADVATFVSGGWDPSTVLSQTFPPEVFMSRPELGLFYVLPKQPALAITVGDLLMMSPLAPPLTGAIGAALVGVGLLAAGIQPAPGFVFVAGMWCVGAVADLVGGPLSPGATSEKTALGSVQHDPRRPTSRPVVRVCLGGRTVGIDRCLWLLAAVAMVWCWTMRDAIATSYFGIGFTALRLLVPPSYIGYIGLLLLSAARVLR